MLLATVVPAHILAQQGTQPDVLFIAIDDLNDWVGPLDGHPQVITPNMDRLAERRDGICQRPYELPAV